MFDPMDEKGFRRTGGLIAFLEKAGGSGARKIFDRLFPQRGGRGWTESAERASSDDGEIKSRAVIYIIGASLAALLIWAAFAPLDEVVHGTGKAIPSSGTQIVQAIDGGNVEDIFVQESQKVKKGQVLVRINGTRYTSSLGERSAQAAALAAKIARLDALTKGTPFTPPAAAGSSAIVEHERQLYTTSLAELNSALSVARQQATERRMELVQANLRRSQLESACDLADRELQATKDLLSSGAVSELEVIRLKKEASRAKADRDQAKAQIAQSRAALSEASGQIREIQLRYTNGWRGELNTAVQTLDSLNEGSKALADRVTQADVKSPVNGTIKRLYANSKGGVIMPGGAVAEVVSDQDELVVEARLSPRDRAFVRPGQPVVVKFTAYEYAVYGGLDGTVEYIGPDTITDDKGATYYTVRIRTKKSSFGPNHPIVAGMVAQTDIITGKRTILGYLLRPLMRAKENAFTEH